MPDAGAFRENWLRPFFFYGNNGCSVCHNLVVSNEAHPKLLTDLRMHWP